MGEWAFEQRRWIADCMPPARNPPHEAHSKFSTSVSCRSLAAFRQLLSRIGSPTPEAPHHRGDPPMPRHDPSTARRDQTEEAHLAVDSVLALLLQYNLAVDAMQRDISKVSNSAEGNKQRGTRSAVQAGDGRVRLHAHAH